MDQQKATRMPEISSIDKLTADLKFRWNQVKLRNTIGEVISKMDDNEKSSLILQSKENDDALLHTLGSSNKAPENLNQAIASHISARANSSVKIKDDITTVKETYERKILDMGQKYEELEAEKAEMQKLEQNSEEIIKVLTIGLTKKTEQNNRVLSNLYKALNVNRLEQDETAKLEEKLCKSHERIMSMELDVEHDVIINENLNREIEVKDSQISKLKAQAEGISQKLF